MKNRKFLATFSLSLVVAASTVFCSIPVQAAEITMAKSAAAVTYGQASSAEIAILKGLFDYEYYKQMNPDVVAKFGDSKDALFNHFVKCGLYEGRSLSANFNVSAYASAYSDLKGKFGSDIIKYYIHYAAVGSKENRPITTLAAAANAGITVTSVADSSVVLTPAAIKAAEAKGITDPAAAMAAAPVATSSGSSSSSSGGGGSASTKQNATKPEDKEETPSEPAATDPINYFDGSGIAHTTYGEFLEIVESTHDTFTVETHNDTEVYVRAGLASAWAAFIAGGSSEPEQEVVVTVTPSSLSKLTTDSAFTLSATVTNADDTSVVWSSSDEDVAIVDEDGLVTIVGAGTANIIATSNEDNTKSGQCELTVTAPAVTVTVTPSSISKLTTDAAFTLSATVENADDTTVAWSSSDETVATVNATTGEVTIVGAGTANIIATSNEDNTKSGQCELTVTE